MQKHFIFTLMLSLAISTTIASAEVIQTQSPIYTDDIGRSHFLGRGGYSSVRHVQMGEAMNSAINSVQYKNAQYQNQKEDIINEVEEKIDDVQSFTSREAEKARNVDFDITNVIKEKPVTPVSNYKSTMSFEKGKMDASLHGGMGGTELPSGVNESKTIYKDDLGRLHFFGKANIIRE